MSKDEKKENLNIIDVRNPSPNEKPDPVQPAKDQKVESKDTNEDKQAPRKEVTSDPVTWVQVSESTKSV
jgi:hypothetical protein